MQAFKIRDDEVALVFTRVLDEMPRGPVAEDEEAEAVPANRAYWEERGSKKTLALADDLLSIAREFDPTLELKYNVHYIGLSRGGQAYNFIAFGPRRNAINLAVRLPRDSAVDTQLEQGGFNVLTYSGGRYRISLTSEDITSRRQILRELIGLAYRNRANDD